MATDEPREAVYIPGVGVVIPLEATPVYRLELETVGAERGTTPALRALLNASRQAATDTRRERHQRIAEQARRCAPEPFTLARAGFTPSQSDWSMTAQEAAAQLGVSQQRVTTLARAGRLRGRQDQRGTWHLDPHSIEDYGKARRKQR